MAGRPEDFSVVADTGGTSVVLGVVVVVVRRRVRGRLMEAGSEAFEMPVPGVPGLDIDSGVATRAGGSTVEDFGASALANEVLPGLTADRSIFWGFTARVGVFTTSFSFPLGSPFVSALTAFSSSCVAFDSEIMLPVSALCGVT